MSLLTFLFAVCLPWQVTDYVWNFGIISQCDKGMPYPPQEYFSREPYFDSGAYQNIQEGDLVWVKCRFLSQFCYEVLPQVKHPFKLVILDGDESFPWDAGFSVQAFQFLVNHPMIDHIFAQNCDLPKKHPKVTPIPIGLDYHTIAYKGTRGGWGEIGMPLKQEADLKRLICFLKPTHLRKKRIFVDFQHSDTMRGGEFRRDLQFGEDRTQIFQKITATGLVDSAPWMRRSHVWQKKGEYAFTVSPHGNGLDCHRTWEDLLLGCIVIVKHSPLDSLYDGLPVVIVQDWNEITEENLSIWLKRYGDALTNISYRKKLTLNYWMEKIKQ